MRKFRFLSILFLLFSGVATLQAQILPTATTADPSASDNFLSDASANLVGGPLNQAGYMTFVIDNNTANPITGNVPPNSLVIDISFPAQWGINAIPVLPGFLVNYTELGPSGTIQLINTVGIASGDQLVGTFPIVGFAAGTGTAVYNVDRVSPVITADAQPGNDFNSLTLTVSQPLPVKLLSFDAARQNSTSLLSWATTMEQNNRGFGIERSADGKAWSNIGFVSSIAANGNSAQQLGYSYTDTAPLNGTNYYRLQQTDVDGKYVYSMVKTVVFDHDGTIGVYPNPATDHARISGLAGDETIRLYDATGRKLQEVKAQGTTVTIDISQWSEGIYSLGIIHANGTVTTKKVIKMP